MEKSIGKKRAAVRILLFFAVFAALFLAIQALLTPQWIWPQFKESTANTLAELETLEDSDIQAYFLGASSMMYAIDPMRLYEESGLVTFNLATSAQFPELSYYVLAEGFKTAVPKEVFLDVSYLFSNDFDNSRYRYVMDSMPLSKNKIDLAKAYAAHFPEEKRLGTFLGAFIPMYQYHDRWKELWINDFTFRVKDWDYFTKGYYLNTITNPAGMNVPWMNDIAQINATTDGWTEEIVDGNVARMTDTTKLYAPVVDRNSLETFLKIKALCEENGAELRLIKIPNCLEPQFNETPWTTIKSALAKSTAAEYGIPFLDLMYDVDLGIDWYTDSCDNGQHLNFRGAKKVTDHLIEYLQNECGLEGHYDAEYETDCLIYDAVSDVSELQMTRSLGEYLQRLGEMKDVTVFFSASDDMMLNLSPEDKAALNAFGLQTNFDALAYSDAYLAVKEGDAVTYEASSNRNISRGGTLRCGSSWYMVSSGWYAAPRSSIVIDGKEYSMNRRGINIVVYDERSKGVLDSVAFDTCSDTDQSGIRITVGNMDYSPLGSFVNDAYLLNYEFFLMENGVQ